MNLFIHPERPLGIVNDYAQGIITSYDLSQPKPRAITSRSYSHFVAAINRDYVWVVYKNKDEFLEPVRIEVWDWNLAPIKSFSLKGNALGYKVAL